MVALNKRFLRPPEDTLNWCRQFVAKMKHNAVWCIPRSKTTFRINHVKKQLELIEAGVNDDDFFATQDNFEYIGWNVVDCTEQQSGEEKTDDN